MPTHSDQLVFYPFEGGKRLTEDDLRARYPWTWDYLSQHRPQLEHRKAVSSGANPWWRPIRTRDPEAMLRPKIVCPHLMLTPRFAIDEAGKFAVSRSPYLIANDEQEETTSLKFFCAILNSSICHWYIQAHAPKYGNGYNRVEVSLVKDIPVLDPAKIPVGQLRELLDLVDEATRDELRPEIESKLDRLVAEFYGLSPSERQVLLGTDIGLH